MVDQDPVAVAEAKPLDCATRVIDRNSRGRLEVEASNQTPGLTPPAMVAPYQVPGTAFPDPGGKLKP